ncbi:tripartite tricarboxylate transporter substrate binding protein [Roseomonas sp. BN140053]|uniref:tripartite tricarboxylate transporter substrate binding protein n=1 Tax=Roseomonas sp. BN140053 TaxID=3391898 RepID=UPI0039E9D9A6
MIGRRRALAPLLLLPLPAVRPARAQGFPSAPLRLLIGTGAGGGADAIARHYAEKLRALCGQPVLVENRPGAGGNLATAAAARAPADGHSILFSTSNNLTGNFFLYRDVPFRLSDFAAVTTLGQSAFALAVNPEHVPADSVPALIAFLRGRGGQATYGSPTSFSLATAQLFLQLSGTEAEQVSYRTSPDAMNDLLGGRIDFLFADTVLALAQRRSGALRVLAVTSAERIGAAPDIPTLAEAGVPNYEMTTWFGAFVPAATPAPVRDRLEDWFNRIAASAETRDFLLRVGADPLPGSAARLDALVREHTEKWRAIAGRTRLEAL